MRTTAKSFLKLSTALIAGTGLLLSAGPLQTKTVRLTPLTIMPAFGEEGVTQYARSPQPSFTEKKKNAKNRANKPPSCKFLIKVTPKKSASVTEFTFADGNGGKKRFTASSSLFAGATIIAGQSCPSKKKGYLSIAIYGLRTNGLKVMSTGAESTGYVMFTSTVSETSRSIQYTEPSPVTSKEARELDTNLMSRLKPNIPGGPSNQASPPVLVVQPPADSAASEDNDIRLDDPPSGGLFDPRCETDDYCKKVDSSLICCKSRDGDVIGQGMCSNPKQCNAKWDGGGGSLPPSGGDVGAGGPTNQCSTHSDCQNLPLPQVCTLGDRQCTHSDQGNMCECILWEPYRCRTNVDCDQWKTKLKEEQRYPCSNQEKFQCDKANEANEFGNCTCRSDQDPPVCGGFPPGGK